MTIRSIVTEDGVRKFEGDRVFNYYDMVWGVIDRIDEDGWFRFTSPERTCSLNGQRVATYDPRQGWRANSREIDRLEREGEWT